MPDDPIDDLTKAWRDELPDLDTSSMVTVARLNRARLLTMRRVEETLIEAGSSLPDFDVLSTLRRQGPPYRMKPSEIARSLLVSASGTTSRIDRLAQAGLVERITDPDNRRIAPVALTEVGIAEAERLVRLLVETEREVVSALSTRERATLDTLLTKLSAAAAGSDRPQRNELH